MIKEKIKRDEGEQVFIYSCWEQPAIALIVPVESIKLILIYLFIDFIYSGEYFTSKLLGDMCRYPFISIITFALI